MRLGLFARAACAAAAALCLVACAGSRYGDYPTEEPQRLSEAACAELPTKRDAFGLKVGERVRDRITFAGDLRGFACDDGVPVGIFFAGDRMVRWPVNWLRSFPQ